jgi:hypothetical protein
MKIITAIFFTILSVSCSFLVGPMGEKGDANAHSNQIIAKLPNEIPGLEGWFDATRDVYTMASCNNLIPFSTPDLKALCWKDLSGNNHNLYHNTLGPQYNNPSAMLNRPGLTFNGTSNVLDSVGYALNQMTLIVVAVSTSSTNCSLAVLTDGTYVNYFGLYLSNSTYALTVSNHPVIETNTPLGIPVIFTAKYYDLGAPSYKYEVFSQGNFNNSYIGNTNPFSIALEQIMIGSRDVTDFCAGVVSEVILFNHPLEEADLKSVEKYLSLKWGIPVGF